jgi:hypothetical protein
VSMVHPDIEWNPLPFRTRNGGHVCEVLYVRGRYWGQIEQFRPNGPCYASTIFGRMGSAMDIAAARATVERTVVKILWTG